MYKKYIKKVKFDSRLGTRINYQYLEGLLHTEDEQPSSLTAENKTGKNIKKEYHRNGKLHRDGDLPSVINYKDGNITSKIYYKEGKIFREGDLAPIVLYDKLTMKTGICVDDGKMFSGCITRYPPKPPSKTKNFKSSI